MRLASCEPDKPQIKAQHDLPFDFDKPYMAGARYLGFGVVKAYGRDMGSLQRPCIAPPFSFCIEFISREPFDPMFVYALKIMGLLGGIGSKMRKGYGSLTLVSLTGDRVEPWNRPQAAETFIKYVRDILVPLKEFPAFQNGLPHYTAFNRDSRIVILTESSGTDYLAGLKLLNGIGMQLQKYRCWGFQGHVNDLPTEENFKYDHGWFRHIIGVEAMDKPPPADFHPRRAVFGLPHNYQKRIADKDIRKVMVTTSDRKKSDRRASPLILHIHAYDNDRYAAVVTILPTMFLPQSLKIKANGRDVPPAIDYSVLDEFVDGFEGKAGAKKSTRYFPYRRPVFP